MCVQGEKGITLDESQEGLSTCLGIRKSPKSVTLLRPSQLTDGYPQSCNKTFASHLLRHRDTQNLHRKRSTKVAGCDRMQLSVSPVSNWGICTWSTHTRNVFLVNCMAENRSWRRGPGKLIVR